MKIKVAWDAKPQTGITTMDTHQLGCKTKKMWDNLKQDEQRKRINAYLEEFYKPLLEPVASDW